MSLPGTHTSCIPTTNNCQFKNDPASSLNHRHRRITKWTKIPGLTALGLVWNAVTLTLPSCASGSPGSQNHIPQNQSPCLLSVRSIVWLYSWMRIIPSCEKLWYTGHVAENNLGKPKFWTRKPYQLHPLFIIYNWQWPTLPLNHRSLQGCQINQIPMPVFGLTSRGLSRFILFKEK